jgi:Tfp pilus assembly protein PilN
MSSKSKAAAPSPSLTANESNGGAGMGGALAEADEEMADVVQAESQRQTFAAPQQSAEFDKYLDDSDQQLRQYLILVRGGEAEKK